MVGIRGMLAAGGSTVTLNTADNVDTNGDSGNAPDTGVDDWGLRQQLENR